MKDTTRHFYEEAVRAAVARIANDLDQALDPAVIAQYGKQSTGEKYLITPNAS